MNSEDKRSDGGKRTQLMRDALLRELEHEVEEDGCMIGARETPALRPFGAADSESPTPPAPAGTDWVALGHPLGRQESSGDKDFWVFVPLSRCPVPPSELPTQGQGLCFLIGRCHAHQPCKRMS